MLELIHQLGIDWRLLLSQAVNFLLLLIILRIFIYKPVIKLLHERKNRIEEGEAKASEADKRLEESNVMAKDRMKEAERQIISLFRDAEEKAKKTESKMLEEAGKKEEAMMKSVEAVIHKKKQEAEVKIREEAVIVIKEAIKRTVEIEPSKIDEELIKKAVAQISKI
jgi:F-type H+-transporting ATPase subunit b